MNVSAGNKTVKPMTLPVCLLLHTTNITVTTNCVLSSSPIVVIIRVITDLGTDSEPHPVHCRWKLVPDYFC